MENEIRQVAREARVEEEAPGSFVVTALTRFPFEEFFETVVHQCRFARKEAAHDLAGRVNRRGSLNLDNWATR